MLVIKMLKKASNKNVNELALYLGKSRNTITSWDNNEDAIPLTEKVKLAQRFGFPMEYWNIGIDKPINVYQKMYADIKKGYIIDSLDNDNNDISRIDEILKYCDDSSNINLTELDHRYEHYKYLSTLFNGYDPIDNSKLSKDHFIFEVQDEMKAIFEKIGTVENDKSENVHFIEREEPELESNDELTLTMINALKEWRMKKAEEKNLKPFQILSNQVINDIVLEYRDGNLNLRFIKNFPHTGVKWHDYAFEIINILSVYESADDLKD